MGLSRRKGRNRPRPSMNVTPLVDVVLVLLIIFMVVLPAMQEGLDIDVPSIDQVDEETDSEVEPFTVSITRGGAFYFDTSHGPQRVPEADLEGLLTERHRAQPRRKMVVRADGAVRYVHVRDLMHMCRNIGFPGVSLRVNARNPDGERVAAR